MVAKEEDKAGGHLLQDYPRSHVWQKIVLYG